jgi:hypothetical protein
MSEKISSKSMQYSRWNPPFWLRFTPYIQMGGIKHQFESIDPLTQ